MQMNRQRASRNTKKNEKKIEQGIAVELMIDIRRQEKKKRENHSGKQKKVSVERRVCHIVVILIILHVHRI